MYVINDPLGQTLSPSSGDRYRFSLERFIVLRDFEKWGWTDVMCENSDHYWVGLVDHFCYFFVYARYQILLGST